MTRASHQAIILQEQRDWSPVLKRMRSLLLVLALVGVVVWVIQVLSKPDLLPFNKIRAQGTFKYVTEPMLQKVLSDIEGGYFSINVGQIQQQVETLAWVDKASIRRVWPDVLLVNIIEQQPLAYWKSGGLINKRGELFNPAVTSYPDKLPMLNGPVGTSKTVMAYFFAVRESLQSINLQAMRVEMDARRALVVWLDNGIKLVLGRNEAMQRLQRFVRVYPKVLAKEASGITQVDMRYTNGFTVKRKM